MEWAGSSCPSHPEGFSDNNDEACPNPVNWVEKTDPTHLVSMPRLLLVKVQLQLLWNSSAVKSPI